MFRDTLGDIKIFVDQFCGIFITKEGDSLYDCNVIETYEDSYHDCKVSTNDVWSSTRNQSERLKEATSQVLKVNLFNFLVACGKLAVKAVPAS